MVAEAAPRLTRYQRRKQARLAAQAAAQQAAEEAAQQRRKIRADQRVDRIAKRMQRHVWGNRSWNLECKLCRHETPINVGGALWPFRWFGIPDDFWVVAPFCDTCWIECTRYFSRRGIVRDLEHRIDGDDVVLFLAHMLKKPPIWLRKLWDG